MGGTGGTAGIGGIVGIAGIGGTGETSGMGGIGPPVAPRMNATALPSLSLKKPRFNLPR